MKMIFNKTTYIIISIVFLFMLLGVGFFSKGSLNIESNVPTVKAEIDGKAITLNSAQSFPIQAGFHTISTTSQFYDRQNISLIIFPWFQKTVSLTLNPNQEGRALLDKGTLLTKHTANFTRTKNSNEYLDSMKEYLTSDAYDSLSFQIEDSLQSQNTTSPTDMPRVFLPIYGSYITDSNDGATVTIDVTKTKDELSVNNIQFVFGKAGSSWLVTNIIYN